MLPDTFLIKLRQQGAWGEASFGNGLWLYIQRFPLEVYLSLVMLPTALSTLFKPARNVAAAVWILWLYAFLHFCIYSWMSVPPFHWYYGPQVVCLILLGALGLARIYQAAHTGWQRIIASTLLVLVPLTSIVGTAHLVVRAGVPLAESFITTNHATPGQYRAIGEYIATHHAGEVIHRNNVEPATIAYYCDCYLLDQTFNVRDWLVEDVELYRSGTSPLDRLLQLNYLFFQPSAAYLRTSTYLNRVSVTDESVPDVPHWFISSRWSTEPRLIVLQQ